LRICVPDQISSLKELAPDAGEEIATCAAASATFPPLFLQWKVIKADGTEELIPAEPKETFSLKLPVVISQEY
jgi:hypothetical protein